MTTTPDAAPASGFRKRIYTLSAMLGDIGDLVRLGGGIRTIRRLHAVEPVLREQMMFAVSMVNGCTFCAYVHNSSALSHDADRVQLAELVGMDPTATTDDRLIAVAWAQSRATAHLGPATEWLNDELKARYTPTEIQNLDIVVRFITLMNISGNTAEALVRRLRGFPVAGSSRIAEIVIGGVYLIGSLPTATIAAVRKRRAPSAAISELRILAGAHR